MLKKLLSITLTCTMVLTTVSALFATSAGAAAIPSVLDVSRHTVKADEDFEVHSAEADYTQVYKATGVKVPFSSITKTSGSITVKQESNGNKYLLFSGSTAAWHQRLNASSITTTNSVLVSFDYRNATGDIRLDVAGSYKGTTNANAIVSMVRSRGTTINNQKPDTSTPQVGSTISLSNGKWTNFKAYIAPSAGTIQFYINDEFWGIANYRKELDTITSLWVGVASGASVELDNVTVTDMGTTEEIFHRFKPVEKYTFDPGTKAPFTEEKTTGKGIITNDGKFKITSSSATNNVTKHYVLGLKDDKVLTDYAKISFDWYVKDAAAGNSPTMHMYINGTTPSGSKDQIGTTVSFTKNSVSAIKTNGSSSSGPVKTELVEGWHKTDILLDLNEYKIYYVIDGLVSEAFPFRYNLKEVTKVFFRIYATSEEDEAQIDNLTFYKVGTTYISPTLTSDSLTIDGMNNKITMTEEISDSLIDMDEIAKLIKTDRACTIKADDVDKNGWFSDGDIVIVKDNATGLEYSYTVDVLESYNVWIESLIVKGTDGQGDNFEFNEQAQPNFIQTITKAGDAEVTCRVQNNTKTAITPFVSAAVYDDEGVMVSIDTIVGTSVAAEKYTDFELDVTIPAGVDNGKLKVFVWQSAEKQAPLMKRAAWGYDIDTNDFVIPNIISDNMILQRNSEVNIFGKAPQGSVVTATLTNPSDEVVAEASYTVPSGSNEFFAVLDLTEQDASTESHKLSITCGENTEEFDSVLLGDVFYGSGQSNMTRGFYSVKGDIEKGLCDNYEPAAGSGETYATLANKYQEDFRALAETLKNVHYYSVKVENSVSRASLDDEAVKTAEVWKIVNRSTVGTMSEILVRLAGYIQSLSEDHKDVPIGVVMSAQGGTKIDKWVSKDVLTDHEAFDGTQERTDYYENKRNDGPNVTPYRWASPADLYYDCVRPVMPYTFKAAVWYQGESDNSTKYDKYVAALINEHRAGFHNEDLPFLVVQLPGFRNGQNVSDGAFSGSGLPLKRLIQENIKNLTDNVYVVVTNDSGDDGNIHPANKDVVSERLARTVLNQLDGVEIPYVGPEFVSVNYTGVGTATVNFEIAAGGTLSEYTTTQGSNFFQLYDGTTWYKADEFEVSENTITLKSSAMAATPTGVRYAYGPEIVKCIYADFGNGVKLPLVPFDTSFIGNTWNN